MNMKTINNFAILRRRIIQVLTILSFVVFLLVTIAKAQPQCFYCGCKDKLYVGYSDCDNDCKRPRMKYSGCQCLSITLSGGSSPPQDQKDDQKGIFPNLDCFAVLSPYDKEYNCIAWSVGINDSWVWDEIDPLYGDFDDVVELEDFDAFYAYFGFLTSASCQQESGKEKVALYGKVDASGKFLVTHAARQHDAFHPGPLWQSKEGEKKVTIHTLSQLESESYGSVFKCYERPWPPQ